MNPHNYKDFGSSDDEAFLQNFQSPMHSNDILADLCKVQVSPSVELLKHYEQNQMSQEDNENSPQKNQRKSKGRSKEKKKIFYRDKMAELLKPGEYIKQEYNYVAYTQYQQNKAPISKQEQLKRNRQSAKNSRQRKKQYVTILQKKNDENLKLIEELIDKLEQVTMERDRLKEYNHQIKNFIKVQSQHYELMQKMVNNPQTTPEQIQAMMEDALQKFGTSGSERVPIINYYMNEVIELLISDIQKYFIGSSIFHQGLTASNPPKNIDLEIMKILDMDIVKRSQILQKYRERFITEASVFKSLTQEFYRIFKSIQNQGKIIELVFKDLIREFEGKKIAALVIWFKENKYCRQVKRMRRQWTEQLKSGEEVVEVIRKQTKQV